MNCYVKSVNTYGQPFLFQARKEVLEACYTDLNAEYPFKVLMKLMVKQTVRNSLKLKDPFGLEHRYYPSGGEPKREVADVFSLLFEGVETGNGNNAHLRLENLVSERAEHKMPTHQVQPVDEDVPTGIIIQYKTTNSKWNHLTQQKQAFTKY